MILTESLTINNKQFTKTYSDSGLWSVERVRNAVVKNWITAEEFKMITGAEYEV